MFSIIFIAWDIQCGSILKSRSPQITQPENTSWFYHTGYWKLANKYTAKPLIEGLIYCIYFTLCFSQCQGDICLMICCVFVDVVLMLLSGRPVLSANVLCEHRVCLSSWQQLVTGELSSCSSWKKQGRIIAMSYEYIHQGVRINLTPCIHVGVPT